MTVEWWQPPKPFACRLCGAVALLDAAEADRARERQAVRTLFVELLDYDPTTEWGDRCCCDDIEDDGERMFDEGDSCPRCVWLARLDAILDNAVGRTIRREGA